MKIAQIMLLALCARIGTANAMAPNSYWVEGVGLLPCAQIAKNYQESPNSYGQFISAWITGYVTASNSVRSIFKLTQIDPSMAGASTQNQLYFILSYCSDNPLKDIASGAQAMVMYAGRHHGVLPPRN